MIFVNFNLFSNGYIILNSKAAEGYAADGVSLLPNPPPTLAPAPHRPAPHQRQQLWPVFFCTLPEDCPCGCVHTHVPRHAFHAALRTRHFSTHLILDLSSFPIGR